jgi:hypothetical protein
MSNIAFVSHGFREGAKAMSKTARGSIARASREQIQHPAILPWPPGLQLCGRGLDDPSLKSAARRLPDEMRTTLSGVRLERAERTARRNTSTTNS